MVVLFVELIGASHHAAASFECTKVIPGADEQL
jgi:hypothetical protein